KYHQDSGLLILRATPGQLEAAGQVVAHMAEGAQHGEAERMMAERKRQSDVARAELDKQYELLGRLRADLNVSRHKMDEAEEAHRKASPNEKEDLSRRVEMAQRQVIDLDMQADRVERDVKQREAFLAQARMGETEW